MHFNKQHGHVMLESLGVEMSKSQSMKDASNSFVQSNFFLEIPTFCFCASSGLLSVNKINQHNPNSESQAMSDCLDPGRALSNMYSCILSDML